MPLTLNAGDAAIMIEQLDDVETFEQSSATIYRGIHVDHGLVYILFLPIGDPILLPVANR